MSIEQLIEIIEIEPLFGSADSLRNALSEGHSIDWSFDMDNFNLKVWKSGHQNREHRTVHPDGFYRGMTGLVSPEHQFFPRSNAGRLGFEYSRAIERKLRKFLGI